MTSRENARSRASKTICLCGLVLAVCLFGVAPASERSEREAFGDDGFASSPAEFWGLFPQDLTQDREGRLVAALNSVDGFVVSRFHRDGTLDRSFAGDGDFQLAPGISNTFVAEAVDTAPNGRIIVAGWRYDEITMGPVLIALTPRGTYARRFGQSGSIRDSSYNGIAYRGVAVQSDGRVVAVGSIDERGRDGKRPGVVFTRYLANGRLDGSFGRKGRVILRNPRGYGQTGFDDVKLRGRKILAAGYRQGGIYLVRLNHDGSLDRSFGGGDGKAMVPLRGSAGCEPPMCRVRASIAADRRGRIVVQAESQGSRTYAVVARFTREGRLDRSFRQNGLVFLRRGAYTSASGVAVERNGRITVAGYSSRTLNGPNRFTVFRLRPSGDRNHTFGRRGTRIYKPKRQGVGTSAILLRGGKVVVGGGIKRSRNRYLVVLVRPAG